MGMSVSATKMNIHGLIVLYLCFSICFIQIFTDNTKCLNLNHFIWWSWVDFWVVFILVRTFIIKWNNDSNEIYYEIITFYDLFCTIQDQNIRSIHKQRILSFKYCCNKFVYFMTARADLVVLNQYNAIVLVYDSKWLLWNQCDVFFKRFHHAFGDIIHWIYQIRSHLVCVVFKREYTKHNAYITYINGSKERFFDY